MKYYSYLPITLLKENKICFRTTPSSRPAWEGRDVGTDNPLTELEISLLNGAGVHADAEGEVHLG